MTDKSKEKQSSGDWTESDLDPISALKLWRAVIALAIADSASGKKHLTLPIHAWIKSHDFDVVCGLANLQPEPLIKIIKELLAQEPIVAQSYSKKVIEQLTSL